MSDEMRADGKHPIELIEWVDSASLDGARGWRSVTEIADLEPGHVLSVGWMVKETDTYVVLISQSGDNQFDGEICIPKIAVIRRKILLHEKNE